MTDGFALKSWVIDILNKVIKKVVPKYSTDETVVGTWIDGKPIYRKVIDKAINGMDLSSLNIDALTNSNAIDNVGKILFTYSGASANSTRTVAYNGNNKTLILIVQDSDDKTNIKVILEYTKTTDKATS